MNGIWLGRDGWFRLYRKDSGEFRTEEAIRKLFDRLEENHIRCLYLHLCPTSSDGAIARHDREQAERVLTLAREYGVEVLPWACGRSGKARIPPRGSGGSDLFAQ